MKSLSLVTLLLIVIFAFSDTNDEVKVIDSPREVDSILKKDKILMNKISCESALDKYCALILDGTDLMIDCPCEGSTLKLEPKLNELMNWDYEEKVKIMKFAHNHFKNSSFNISYIEMIKIEEQVYLFVQLFEKLNPNRILFTIEK